MVKYEINYKSVGERIKNSRISKYNSRQIS